MAGFRAKGAIGAILSGFVGSGRRQSIGFADAVHHPADISQASAPRRVLGGTLTSPGFFFSHDSFHDGGRAIRQEILLDVGGGVTEAITNQAFHRVPFQRLAQVVY
jgi:hypothetical protein